jgi:hypothetical protein
MQPTGCRFDLETPRARPVEDIAIWRSRGLKELCILMRENAVRRAAAAKSFRSFNGASDFWLVIADL